MSRRRCRAPALSEDEFEEHVVDAIAAEKKNLDEKVLRDLLARMSYIGGDAEEGRCTTALRARARSAKTPVFYLATPPSMFDEIAEELAAAGLVGERAGSWSRSPSAPTSLRRAS